MLQKPSSHVVKNRMKAWSAPSNTENQCKVQVRLWIFKKKRSHALPSPVLNYSRIAAVLREERFATWVLSCEQKRRLDSQKSNIAFLLPMFSTIIKQYKQHCISTLEYDGVCIE